MELNINKLNFDFELELKDMFYKNYPIEYSEKQSTDDKFVFVNDEINAKASLILLRGKNSVCVRFECEIGNFGGWDRNNQLAAYDTVTLKLYDKNCIKDISGGDYEFGAKSDCWTRAFTAKSMECLPERMASVLMKKDNTYYHFLPLCQGDFKGEIKDGGGCMSITMSPYSSGYMRMNGCAAVITWGIDPYKTAHDNVANGFDFLGLKNTMTENKRCSEIFDYLGWCSWDGFRTNVNSEGVYGKLDEFKKKGVPVRWVLIDDGWYRENDETRQMQGYTEVKEKFPEGIKNFISTAKNKYDVKYIGFWECYGGGWNGIDPNSEITAKHGDTVDIFPDGFVFPKTDEAGSFLYWNRRHEYLNRCGVDFLKIDVECQLETTMHGRKSVGETARDSIKAIEASVGLYFDGACINCTGMGQEMLWNRPVGMVNRNSEDFEYNNVKTMNGFVNNNIFNSFYHSYFSVTDWDMMMSGNETTRMNVVLHAVCGGPVYLSDRPGETNAETVLPFCLSDGRLLKCDGYAMPAEENLFINSRNEKYPLKAWNMSGQSGVLALFNVFDGEETIDCKFNIGDIHSIKGDKFILYDWFGKKMIISDKDTVHKISIKPYEAFLFIAVPMENNIAILGDKEKYISAAVIEKRIVNDDTVVLILKDGCKLSFYAQNAPVVTVNGKNAVIQKDADMYIVDCSDIDGNAVVTLRCKTTEAAAEES